MYDHQLLAGKPSHLVMFNVLQPRIQLFLEENDYANCAKLFHTHFPEGRVGTHVLAYCRTDWLYQKRTKEGINV